MADVQQPFEEFHDTIRIDFETSKPLREKRDVVLARIKKYLSDNGLPTCDELLQGSYRMKTGVVPIDDLEFDIDIGLRFAFAATVHSASEVRNWIWCAVRDHTKSIEDKGPCIRVSYEQGYHLDLVAYATWDEYGVKQFRLAHKTQAWRPADPPALIDIVDTYRAAFANTTDTRSKTDQFRRCVRYMKRWNDERIPTEEEFKPAGLTFVLLAMKYGLEPTLDLDASLNDAAALEGLLAKLLQSPGRIKAPKPTPEFEDLLARLSEPQMADFKSDLQLLLEAIRYARGTVDTVAACKQLHDKFGRDFPVPTPSDSARKSAAPTIITSSRSA